MSLVMHCEPCGKSFSGPVSYNQHKESDKHKKKISSLNILSKINENKVLNTSEILSSSVEHSSDTLECSTCCLRFDSFKNFQIHSLSAEHAKRILENAQMREENVEMDVENDKNMVSLIIGNSAHCNNVERHSNAISDKSDTILPEVEMMKSQAFSHSFSFCDTCKKSFSGPEPYKQHIESAGHIKKTKLEKEISLRFNAAAPEFSCAPCKKTFSGLAPYDQHMNSDIHRKKIQSLQLLEKFEVDSGLKGNRAVLEPGPLNKESNPWYCKTCDVICSGPAPFEQHNNGVIHLKNLLKAQGGKGSDDVLCGHLQINGLNMPKEDIVVPGLMGNNEDAHTAKLDELITVFLPEEEISFGEQGKKSNSNSAEPNEEIDSDEQNKINMKSTETDEDIDSDEQNNKTNFNSAEPNEEIDPDEQNNKNNFKLAEQNSGELERIQITLNACSLTMQEKENIPEDKIEEKSDLFQICNYCNVKLFNKDEAINHYESLEHFQRRWS